MTYDSRESSTAAGRTFELYLFQTQDSVWRLTSANEQRMYQGAIYRTETISRTNTTASNEVKGGHIKVSLPNDHPIAQLFISYIPSTPLTLVVFRGHEGEADSEMKVAFVGRVLLARFTTDDKCELDCAPDTEILQRPIATACFQRQCNRILFSAGCGVPPGPYKVLGQVTAISSDGLSVTVPACAGKPDGYFNLGFIEKYSTDRRMIMNHAGTVLTLINPLLGLNVGDNLVVYAGCDRSYARPNGCTTKFNNGSNFMGWEWLPSKNPFSSGLG